MMALKVAAAAIFLLVSIVAGTNARHLLQQTREVSWVSGRAYQPLTISVGDSVNFVWTGTHDVWQVPSGTCPASFTAGNGLTRLAAESRGGRHVFSATAPGTFYFACSVADHCLEGQIITVNVQGAAAATSPAAAPAASTPAATPAATLAATPAATPAATRAASPAAAPVAAPVTAATPAAAPAAANTTANSSATGSGYGGASSAATSVWTRGTVMGNKLLLNGVGLNELKGTWQTLADLTPITVAAAFENNTLPSCTSDDTAFTYERMDASAPQFVVFAGPTNQSYRMNVNLQRSTFGPLSGKNNSLLLTTNAQTNAVSCAHWQPFVHLPTGELYAESITMTLWARNATNPTGPVVRTSMNCEVKGNEMPGCYTGEIERAAMPNTGVQTLSINRPAGSVVSITKQTFVCRNGECLRMSPRWSVESPAYGA